MVRHVEKIADNLKALRKKKGWSQAKVAERVPIDRTTYCKYAKYTPKVFEAWYNMAEFF